MNQAIQRMLTMYYVQRQESKQELEYIEQVEVDLVEPLEEEEGEQQGYCVGASEAEQVRSSSDHTQDKQRYQETMEAEVPIDNSDALYRYPSMLKSEIIYTRSSATQTGPSRQLNCTQTHLGHASQQIITYLKSFLCTSFSWTRMVVAVALLVVVVGDIVTLVFGYCYYGLTAHEVAWGVAIISSFLLLIFVVYVCPSSASSLCKFWFAVHVTYADDWARKAAVCLFNLQVQPVLEAFHLTHITKNVNEPVFDWWFIQGLLLSILVHCIMSSNQDEEEDEDEELNYEAEGQEDNGSVLTDVLALNSSSTHHQENFSYINEPCEALIEVTVWENNSLVYERREVYGWAEDPGRQNQYEQPQEIMTEVSVGDDNQVSFLLPVPVSESQVTH